MAAGDVSLPCTDNETGILDLPDEILSEIISLLSHRERVSLGTSCQRLKTLVFEDERLLRCLDFSKKAGLTTVTDIQEYFNNENACLYTKRINAEDVTCIKAGDPLNNSIGRAINLMDVNIHGTQFKDIEQLGSFLKPLEHLEKLSIDWPVNYENDINLCRRILQRPFSKLTYLSVRLDATTPTMFTSYLSLCQQLKELYIESPFQSSGQTSGQFWSSEIRQLTNLNIIEYRGGAEAVMIRQDLAKVIAEPERWTDFRLCIPEDLQSTVLHFEKDVEVCKELLQSKNLYDIFMTPVPRQEYDFKWTLRPECLLKEVLTITHDNVPEELCCLEHVLGPIHFLKVNDAKMLLKDPRYQISYLYLTHNIERNCDVHLLASAFPNLAELVLHSVIMGHTNLPRDSYCERNLRRRISPAPQKYFGLMYPYSSFNLIVENTPNLRHFTLGNPGGWERSEWDMDALQEISNWPYLETFRMTDTEMRYESATLCTHFLVEIGRQCGNLQKLSLCNVTSTKTGSFDEVTLLRMLGYSRNLRDFTIWCHDIDQAKIFTKLAKNRKLERVEAVNDKTQHSAACWISSLKKMILQCPKLTTIICKTTFKNQCDLDKAATAVKRIKAKCRRLDFQIKVTCVDSPELRRVVVGAVF